MLSRLLHVQHPTAKQAVITAIDLLGIYKKFFDWRLASEVAEFLVETVFVFQVSLLACV